jgi:hypothetical protein
MHGRVIQQNDDPLRHPVIRRLAAAVPSSKRTVSKLVCPVTGIVMEGNNEPVALPNGYVYGSLAVYGGLLDWNGGRQADASAGGRATAATATAATATAATADSPNAAMSSPSSLSSPSSRSPDRGLATRILCPCTGDSFSMDQVRKLFIV